MIINNTKDFAFQVTKAPCINLVWTQPNRNLSVSFFANLLRATEITWSILSILKFRDKAIRHSQTSFKTFRIYINPIHDGRGEAPHTSFSLVTSTNVGIRPQNSWSNPYKIEVMITSLIEMLELPKFGHTTASTI